MIKQAHSTWSTCHASVLTSQKKHLFLRVRFLGELKWNNARVERFRALLSPKQRLNGSITFTGSQLWKPCVRVLDVCLQGLWEHFVYNVNLWFGIVGLKGMFMIESGLEGRKGKEENI